MLCTEMSHPLTLLHQSTSSSQQEEIEIPEGINITRQCLEVCKVAGEIYHQNKYSIEKVIAEDNSDQVVVTTLADLFGIKKAPPKSNLVQDDSAQLISSMMENNLRHLAEKHYT